MPNDKKNLILKTVLITFLCLGLAASLVYLGFWYGQKQAVLPPSKGKIKSLPPTEVPFGDEDLDTDAEYQRQMQELTNQGAKDETTSWTTYTNNPYGFAFKYPETVFLLETDGTHLPLVYLATYPIVIPEAYGGPLTPVEIRVDQNTALSDQVAIAKDLYYPDTIKQVALKPPLKGVRISGTLQGMLDGEYFEQLILDGPQGLILINYIPNDDFTPALFNQILNNCKFLP